MGNGCSQGRTYSGVSGHSIPSINMAGPQGCIFKTILYQVIYNNSLTLLLRIKYLFFVMLYISDLNLMNVHSSVVKKYLMITFSGTIQLNKEENVNNFFNILNY